MTLFFLPQVTLNSMRHVTEYSELDLDPGSEILRDMVLDRTEEHVYVLSETKVGYLNKRNCENQGDEFSKGLFFPN